MIDYWFEWLVSLAGFLIVVIIGSVYRDGKETRRELDEFKHNTYTKAETIEHIDVRINPVEERVKEVHKDVKDIRDWLMNKGR